MNAQFVPRVWVAALLIAGLLITSPCRARALDAAACAALTAPIPRSAIGLPSGDADTDSATFTPAAPTTIAERGPTPASRVIPANPAFCKVLGHIQPLDPSAPPIQFEVNLPADWNGRSVQYGGGGSTAY